MHQLQIFLDQKCSIIKSQELMFNIFPLFLKSIKVAETPRSKKNAIPMTANAAVDVRANTAL
ncbi:hypothetical protein DERP_001974 [Dermatophagoides pteronyssinus]|uniref:Uncharacterized protein n=1 Tax=Dermatophagoides pteronyssinus TaxID=6956 RepID=A0ABQ8JCH7_DERPT|nr:hypothetical protein DERP_001974 [Dermatophagoides pteronyssinus]